VGELDGKAPVDHNSALARKAFKRLSAASVGEGARLPWRGAMESSFSFPAGFVWGTATAAAQIEGAAALEGKGASVWDVFAAEPGRTKDGLGPAVACDHYHRYAQDFALMRALGVKHYRFSLSWARLFPDGDARANTAGFGFYHRLIDAMLAHGITPWCTFYHWDMPQALEARGGWRVRETTEAFATYAHAAVAAFGDRVKHWFTLNEIPAFVIHGHKLGLHAPGATEPPRVINQVFHHALLAHGLAVRAVRMRGGPGAQVGLVHNPEITVPWAETPEHTAAAREVFAQTNEHVLAPVFNGGVYPARYLVRCGADAPEFTEEDMTLIGQPTDFLGLNVYRGHFVRAGADGQPELLPLPDGFPRAQATWLHHVPQAMYWGRNSTSRKTGSVITTRPGCPRTSNRSMAGRNWRGICPARFSTCTAVSICGVICNRSTGPSRRACPWTVIFCGRSWTTSSGPMATRRVSAWCTSTTPRNAARRSSAHNGMPK
jgi:beta-glucosidase